ncbi:glycosyltransferase family 4 protein [Marinobacterium sp. xm-d-564]|uniref:glycosyltransferase family 4 protein n=1 Tax=Marinobacterium sp. xm-d-564 TaxID=2497742 RepID=UPI001568D3A5|nr:glycosyltransferase family 4 protein [Marinobacterium sp. xm-d-564]NRP59898.1 Glycosyl transferases group 1 [Marinobacterium sp. xm-d-564]
MKGDVLLIGPFPEPVHGCSLANMVLYKGLVSKQIAVDRINMGTVLSEDIGSFTWKKLFFVFGRYLSIYKIFFFKNIYLTPGQTFLGVLKYAPYILIGRLFRKNVIFHVHGNYLWQEYERSGFVKRKIVRFLISRSSKGIVLSESLRKNLLPFLPSKDILTVHNFFEDFLISPELVKEFSSLKVVFLSNLMTEKGIFDLLDALEILVAEGVSFEARIAGGIDTDVQKAVRDRLHALGPSVSYVGVVAGAEKKSLLSWANTFVLPTYYRSEGQPISLIEAMATGNAIVTTRHAGIPDILTDCNAFFVDDRSPSQIAAVLKDFYSDTSAFVAKSEFNLLDSKKFNEVAYTENILEVLHA